jgi:hypothetical protein
MSGEGFIGRWSRKKREAAAPAQEPPAAPEAMAPPVANAAPVQAPEAAPSPTLADPHALPPLESLTSHSDFSAFLRPGVEPATRAQALKTLFGDPALYPMDGLDVYIDDYSKPDPLPAGWLEKLNQYAALDTVPAAEEAARKAEAEKLAANDAALVDVPAEPATPAAIEDVVQAPAQVPDAAPGTAETARASDYPPPGDPSPASMYRDPI